MLKKKIFISYKRNIEPDEPVAVSVFNKFRQKHDVFIDQTMLLGTRWAKQIEAQLRKTDYLVSFISKESVNSDMVLEEIETAYGLYKKYKKPIIIPVRMKYTGRLVYPLSAYLNSINYFLWENEGDTAELFFQLEQAFSGQEISNRKIVKKTKTPNPKTLVEPSPRATPITLESPDTSMDVHSRYYIERDGDQIALDAIQQQGVTITIKGPRQMGKSTLLNNIVECALGAGKKVTMLDFQLMEMSTLSNPRAFYQQFCRWLSSELGLSDRVDQYWKEPLGNPKICSNYVSEYLLKNIKQPLVIAMDEVEKIFDTDFRSDFFGMLRNWHNQRANTAAWKKLDLALVTSTEPYLFITNLNQSPFNVGEIIDLEDFDHTQIHELNVRHGRPLTSSDEIILQELLGGHPYLIRKSLYMIAANKISFVDLVRRAADDDGPFGDHLRSYLFKLHSNKELLSSLLQVMNKKKCPEKVFFRLHGAGLIKRENDYVVTRNQLYETYFKKRLNGKT
jgi:hypothetical protein